MFKKILAWALAVAMLTSMSVTAFAANGVPSIGELKVGDIFFYDGMHDASDVGGPSFLNPYWNVVDNDNIVLNPEDSIMLGTEDIKDLEAGDKIVAQLFMVTVAEDPDTADFEFDVTSHIRKSDVSRYKADIIWDTDEGEELVEAITIEPFTIFGSLQYCVAIQIKDDVEVDMADFVGRLILYKTSKSNPISAMQLNAEHFATRGYGAIGFNESGFEEIYPEAFETAVRATRDISSLDSIMHSTYPVRNFDAADANDRASFYFTGIGYYHTRVIDTEGDKYMAFNTVPHAEIEDANPKAHIDYVNFPGNIKFHQFGVMELFMEEGQHIYAMEDGVMYTLEDFAKMQRENQELIYDEEDLTVAFQMNDYPDTFIYSDIELEMPMEDEVVEEAEKEIPETGGVLAE